MLRAMELIRSIVGLSTSSGRLMATFSDGTTADQGAVETGVTNRYRAKHTIATGANYTVTWPAGMFAAAPTVQVTVNAPASGAGSTSTYHWQLVGDPTTTGCVIRIVRTTPSLATLLGLTILSVDAGAVNVTASVWAAPAS